MKLREYYALQSEHIRSLQNSLASESTGTKAAAAQKVRPLIMGGLLNLSVLDPKIADLSIKTTVWVEGTLDDLKAMLDRDAGPASELGSVHDKRAAMVTVGVGTLDPLIGKTWKEFKVSSHLAQSWVRNGFAGLKGVAKSAELLIGIGSLYLLNDAMGKNLIAAEAAIGDKSREARLALQGSTLAVLGAGIEVVGAVLKGGAAGMQAAGILSTSGSNIAKVAARTGEFVMRSGAIIVAATGVYDGMQAITASSRASSQGDDKAADRYFASAVLFVVGAGFGVAVAASSAVSLLGGLGIALIFGISGYGVGKWAEKLESAPFEFWARRCFFGFGNEIPKVHWVSHEQSSVALAELNVVLLGIQAKLSFEKKLEVTNDPGFKRARWASSQVVIGKKYLKYKIVIPNYDEHRSAYRWSLSAYLWGKKITEHGAGGAILVGQEIGCPAQFDIKKKSQLTSVNEEGSHEVAFRNIKVNQFVINNIRNEAEGASLHSLEINGDLELLGEAGKGSINSVSLLLTYWPDRNIPEGFAEVYSIGIDVV